MNNFFEKWLQVCFTDSLFVFVYLGYDLIFKRFIGISHDGYTRALDSLSGYKVEEGNTFDPTHLSCR